ncbi:MAG: lactate racemase domain-containing protein [Isosphaeraceae bacterium]
MRVVVDFQDDRLEFELPREQIVASWNGPKGIGPSEDVAAVREAMENPRDFPALRHLVVPGDKVVIALDPTIPRPAAMIGEIGRAFVEAGIAPEDLSVLAMPGTPGIGDLVPIEGSSLRIHDPDDRAQIAYLASTKQGRRVYLSRSLTDADVVVPVGRLGYDPDLGYRGPWSVVFPGLSDRGAMRAMRNGGGEASGEDPRGTDRTVIDESFEVNWLLGTQFHIGLLPGADGLLEVVAGRDAAVRDRGIESLERQWTFRAPSRAELVVAGVGRPGEPATLEHVADALLTATQLVQHGGKIILLSRATGPIGPALRKLMDIEDPKNAAAALRGQEASEDYRIARRLARALAWADLFVYSALEPQVVEELSIVPLERPEQALRLVARSGSTSFISRAELTLAEVEDEKT